mgnify:CR=1 FL=1
MTAKEIAYKEQGFYDDIDVGVIVDWDADDSRNTVDTRNEIDVMLMRDLVPVFISCKNGDIGEEELYKLHTVATRFGGPHVRKMLIATKLSQYKVPKSRDSLMQRAKDMDILTVGIVTIPFRWEGNKKIDQALDGVEEISNNVDALLVINNEKLGEIYPDLSVISAFAKANDTLLIAAKSIAEIITMRGIINLDFNDVKTVLKDGGVAIMSTGYGEGESRVTTAINEAQHSPLLNNNDIFKSQKVLLNITYSSEHELMMNEMEEVREFMNKFNSDFETKFGMAIDDSLGQKVKITLLATGFGVQDIHMKEMDDRMKKRTIEEEQRLAELEEIEEGKRSRREKFYDKDSSSKIRRKPRRNIYLFSLEDLDNDNIISMVETVPTFQRSKDMLDSIQTRISTEDEFHHTENSENENGNVIHF